MEFSELRGEGRNREGGGEAEGKVQSCSPEVEPSLEGRGRDESGPVRAGARNKGSKGKGKRRVWFGTLPKVRERERPVRGPPRGGGDTSSF